MSRLIESIRLLDGQFHNLDDHQRRILASMNNLFKVKPAWSLENFLQEKKFPLRGLFKCRVVYDHRQVECSFSPYTIRPVRSLKLVEDNVIKYDHKFEDRRTIEELFKKRGEQDDILIIKDGQVTDASYANILFKKSGEWFTPSSFLLNGVMRKSLIESGRVREMQIRVKEIPRFEKFKLVNALLEWGSPESDVSNIT